MGVIGLPNLLCCVAATSCLLLAGHLNLLAESLHVEGGRHEASQDAV